MIVKEVLFKDIPALSLTTGGLRAIIVPEQGGKIASLTHPRTGKEYLLQNPSAHFLHMGPQDAFEQCECAGFDDMFPTVDPVCVRAEDGARLDYPDHGEVCRVPFRAEVCEDALTLSYLSKAFGYFYEKRFTEDKDGGVRISYRIENRSPHDLDVLWAAHLLVNAEQGGQLLLPFPKGEPTDMIFDKTGLYRKGERIPLSHTLLYTNWKKGMPVCRKFYFPRRVPRGFVGYRFPTGDTLMMEFDRKQLPYLGLWINLGYLNGAYCVGLEPASVGYDTVKQAEAYGQKDVLKKGACKKFFIRVSLR